MTFLSALLVGALMGHTANAFPIANLAPRETEYGRIDTLRIGLIVAVIVAVLGIGFSLRYRLELYGTRRRAAGLHDIVTRLKGVVKSHGIDDNDGHNLTALNFERDN